MPKRLSDNREAKIRTIDEARDLFNRLARIEINVTRIRAQAESRIATIKAQTEERVAKDEAELEAMRSELGKYIEAHPEEFKKPRNVSTSFGYFGLQKANKVKITDKEACIDFVVDQGMKNCFKPTYKLVKKGIQAALEAGTKVIGARLLKGDIAHYKIDRDLLVDAKAVE